MLPTYCAVHLPIIARVAPMAILTRLPATLVTARRNYTGKSIFDPDDEDEKRAKKQQLPDDKPWDGEEPVNYSVLRMIMDKYRAPLRVEGAARRNIPQPQSNYIPAASQKEEKSSQKKKVEREVKAREMKQNRIMNAKDAAFYYSFERKYPAARDEKNHIGDNVSKSTTKKDIDWEDWDLQETHISINDMGVLPDEMIRPARARGVFDDLPGRGKPLEEDPLINNPFVDRTEYYLNRIIQRNGAAPPWVMMQQEVDTDISTLRSQMNSAIKRCLDEIKANNNSINKSSLLKGFESLEKSYFAKELGRVNMRVRSYNVMCPVPVRKQLLELDKQLKSLIEKHGLI
jgi:hypothetical protein